MKRLIITLLVGTFMCLGCFAQDKEFANGFSSGGFWIMKDGMSGGFGEWSIPILNKDNGFYLRNNINIGGFGSTSSSSQIHFGGGIIGDRIIYGESIQLTDFAVKTYGFTGAGFGIFGSEGHKPFSNPFILSVLCGGGFELQYSQKSSFVMEFGGNQDIVVGKNRAAFADVNSIDPILILGYRRYY